jgi:hypothetical protein
VSLEIFLKVQRLPLVNQKIDYNTPSGTFVALYSNNSRKQIPSAFGYTCPKSADLSPVGIPAGTNSARKPERKSVSIVRVVKVKIPGLLLEEYITPDVTLDSFGDAPFTILVKNSCIRTASESIQLSVDIENLPMCGTSEDTNDIVNIEDNGSTNTAKRVPSRVLKGPFHLMDMLKISLRHGMAKDFMRRFRDCLFVVDLEDKRKVEEYLHSVNSNWETCLIENPDFLFERVRRYIPPADQLLPIVKLLFEKYGPSKCSRTGLPLFDKEAYKTADRILSYIELGHISDVVGGPSLYTEKGVDRHGLMRYHCVRGTNSVEGSVHMNIVRKFAYNAGPRLTDMVLTDYRLCHNLDVS